MAKAEISWKRHGDDGETLQVYAHHVGKRWKFYIRQRRYEQWQTLEHPPLDVWLKLLDAIRRRVARRLLRPEEIPRVKKTIRELFPEAEM
jgi:predicted carbohydrate-binding protein with CBM5 and CBM33 domain